MSADWTGRFSGKVAIVTGAAGGIGYACARRLGEEGAKVALVDLTSSSCDERTRELQKAGISATFHGCDLADGVQIEKVVSEIVNDYGQVDILHNNAGVLNSKAFVQLDPAEIARVLAINLTSVLLFSQAIVRQMITSGRGGAIVNTSSVAAQVASGNDSVYSASKGGLAALTRSLAIELAGEGIRVNAVGPAGIATSMIANLDARAMDSVISRTPLGRLGHPEEVAAAVCFLASDEASFITGQTLYVDGGRLAMNLSRP